MKTKRTIFIIFSYICLLLLIPGCNRNKNSHNKGENVMNTYDIIYQNTKTKKELLVGKTIYKAEYGYVDNNIQGYNNFYYQIWKNDSYANLAYNDGKWISKETFFQDGLAKTAINNNITITFISPENGEVTISGNPKIVNGTNGILEIYINDTLLKKYEISDEMGIYHNDKVTIAKNDQIHFKLIGDVTLYYNPTIDYLDSFEKSLHHSPEGYYGDVHPFYDEKNNKMYMYYLSTGKQEKPIEIYSSLLTTSKNMIQYNDTTIKVSTTNPPEQNLYYALGVYEDAKGNYRSSFGYGNYAGATLSNDLITWSQGATPYIDDNDGLFKYTFRAYFDSDVTSGRDPDIYYDKDTKKYYCVVMNYYTNQTDKGEKGLALYIANQDGKYSTKAYKLLNCTGRGDPECPQLKKIGTRWYLFYSIYGTGTSENVGKFAYRVGDENTSPELINWNNLPEYYLDGGDLHAAQIVKVRDKFYMYGWINYEPLQNVWGGYLNLAREVYQSEDGTLRTRLDEKITSLLNRGIIYKDDNNISINEKIEKDLGNYYRCLIFSNIKINKTLNYAGYKVSDGKNNWYIVISNVNDEKYLAITSDLNNLNPSTSIKINDQNEFNLKIVIDNNFIEAFVNDEYGVVANTTLLNKNYKISLIGNGNLINIAKQKICKLADYNNIFD